MKAQDIVILAGALALSVWILKKGGVTLIKPKAAGYGDTTRYKKAVSDVNTIGGWGIE
jgi:hypothetical protein